MPFQMAFHNSLIIAKKIFIFSDFLSSCQSLLEGRGCLFTIDKRAVFCYIKSFFGGIWIQKGLDFGSVKHPLEKRLKSWIPNQVEDDGEKRRNVAEQ